VSGTSRVRYERRGAGTPLLLLHGIGHHWQAWEPVLDRLAEAHDVVAIDLPGFGETPPPARPARTMADLVSAITEIIDGLGLGRPHVAGNSLGGALALELACTGVVASVTALSPAGFWTPAQARRALVLLSTLRLASGLPESALRVVMRRAPLRALAYGTIYARPRQLSAEAALAGARALRTAASFTTVARAGRGYGFRGTPTVPVTVAWGTRDRVLPYRQAALARQVLPHARHIDLDGCGHVPMLDDPDLVTRIILETTAATVEPGQPAA
jgi:pimeloyl-ACP methyl ester carboxylesterase